MARASFAFGQPIEAVAMARADGAVDLRLFPFGEKIFEVKNAWEFYGGEFLLPGTDFSKYKSRHIPFVSISPKNLGMGPVRHGTFHIRLLLPEAASQFVIFFPEMRSACKIWINGELSIVKGEIAASFERERPENKPLIHTLTQSSQQLDIVLQISAYSNFDFMGASIPIMIGHPPLVYEKFQSAKVRDGFVVGAIFIMAFYHFSLYLLRRERLDPLLFGLFCLWVAIRTVVRSDGYLIYQLFEQPDFTWHYRFEYLGFALSAAFCALLFYVLYPRNISKTIAGVAGLVSFLYALLVTILPLRVHGFLLIPFEIFILGCAAVMIVGLIRASVQGRNGASLLVFGFIAFMLCAVNDILRNHAVIETPTMAHLGLFFFILLQAIILSKRFSRAFTLVKEAETEIRHLNDALEQKVKDRTHTIRVILDNVKAGFLLVSSDLKIAEGFTRSCQDILQRPIDVGQNFLELFAMTPREKEQFKMAMVQVFSDLLPDEVSLGQISSRVSIGQRVISLQGSIVRREDKSVRSILFTIADATLLVQAEREARLNQGLMSIMQDRAGFHQFIVDSLADLGLAHVAVEMKDQTQVRMILHTLKGNFSTYSLDPIARAIHEKEDHAQIQSDDIASISQLIESFMQRYRELIGDESSRQQSRAVMVPPEAFESLRQSLLSLRAPFEVQRVFEVWVNQVKLVPFRTLLGTMLNHCGRLAVQLGKELEIRVIGGDLLVSPEALQAVVQNLGHMLRNAIDHGVEYPEFRHPKPARAKIELSIWRSSGLLMIALSDDGQGLDLDRIGEVAIERGLMSREAYQSSSIQEKAQLIFRPGFSTAKAVSEISGRGFGMSSLQESVQLLGGMVQVSTVQGVGCRFEIQIPEVAAAPRLEQSA